MSDERVSVATSPLPESPGGSPGSILRRCREFHGITLEEASETTKIGISHLKALEDDQIREFANQAYLKGFLRIYATYLGLNSDDIARMYGRLFGGKNENPEPVGTPAIPDRPRRRLVSLKKMLLPALLLAGILVTAIFFKRPPPPPVRQPPPVPSVPAPVQPVAVQEPHSSARIRKPEQYPAQKKVEARSPVIPEVEKTASEKRPSEHPRGFILKIRVTQNGTLSAVVDSSGPQRYDLTIGDVIEWKADQKVSLELSNAGGVEVELNGTPFRSLGPLGKPVYVELDAEGIKKQP